LFDIFYYIVSRMKGAKERLGNPGDENGTTLELILNNLPIGIIFCDVSCNIQFINRTYAEYLGVGPNEVIGEPITRYIPDSHLDRVISTGQLELGDKCHFGEGDRQRELIVNRIPVRGKDNAILGVISQSLFGDLGELRELSERIEALEKKVDSYKEKIKIALSARYTLQDIKGQSAGIVQAKGLLRRYAKTSSPVLIVGATGTGKELFANALHVESLSHKGPFVSINCAAIPQELLESELFGYVSGAFTGAQREGKMGQIELADKGTLFLDEIGDMPLQAQVKLLRVLEDKILFRLGCTRPKKVGFRLIAATNRDLKAMIQEGLFREELYYRLNTMMLVIPPLRERKEDIPIMVRHLLDGLHRPTTSFSEEAMEALMHYHWPGNIRELKNVIERAASLFSEEILNLGDLPAEIVPRSPAVACRDKRATAFPLALSLANSERQLICDALSENGWNIVRTAKVLGVSRAALYEKMKKHGTCRPEKPRNGGG